LNAFSKGDGLNTQPINRKTLLHTRLFEVEEIQVELPNHKRHPYQLVRHADSVTILPMDEHECIHWVSQYRVGVEDTLMELPAGVIEEGETSLECAQREIQEETGMAAADLQPLGSFYLAPGYCSEANHAFLARQLRHSPLAQDEDEFIHIHILSIMESFRLAEKGKIQDAKSLATLLLARPFLFK
jgi:ADP-ribose pyrophosphatase